MINHKNNIINTIIVIILGLSSSTVIGLIAYITLPAGSLEVNDSVICGVNDRFNGIARKWDGTCSGWTNEMARSYVFHSLKFFVAYNIISIMLLLAHPIKWNKPWSVAAVILPSAFVFACGLVHLFDAYTVFYPIYNTQISFMKWSGWISLIASAFVVFGLEKSGRHKIVDLEDNVDVEKEKLALENLNKNKNIRNKIKYESTRMLSGIPTISIEKIPIKVENFPLKQDIWGLVRFPDSYNYTSLIYEFKELTPFGWHKHFNKEILIVLEGEIEVLMYQDDEVVANTLKKGGYIEIPPNTDHDAVPIVIGSTILVIYIPGFMGDSWGATSSESHKTPNDSL